MHTRKSKFTFLSPVKILYATAIGFFVATSKMLQPANALDIPNPAVRNLALRFVRRELDYTQYRNEMVAMMKKQGINDFTGLEPGIMMTAKIVAKQNNIPFPKDLEAQAMGIAADFIGGIHNEVKKAEAETAGNLGKGNIFAAPLHQKVKDLSDSLGKVTNELKKGSMSQFDEEIEDEEDEHKTKLEL